MRKALLVVDAQANMFDEDFCVANADEVIENIRTLIESARDADTPLIYIRNNGGADEPDQPNTPGWEIYAPFAPLVGEKVIDKAGPDAFAGTSLQSILDELSITHLVITGMQSEVCIITSGERAVALGYQVTLVEDAHTTFDFDDSRADDAIQAANTLFAEIANCKKTTDISFQ